MRFRRFSLLIAVTALAPQFLWAAASYNLTSGSYQAITEWAVCKGVDNSSGFNIFIPTNTAGEWSSFYTNPPNGVSVSSCVTCAYNEVAMTADGNCTVPGSCTFVKFKAWGAGGGGGGGGSSTGTGAPGGGGGYSEVTIATTAGLIYTVEIGGSGGAGGYVATGTPVGGGGGGGGYSRVRFGTLDLVIAAGGGGGGGGDNAAVADPQGFGGAGGGVSGQNGYSSGTAVFGQASAGISGGAAGTQPQTGTGTEPTPGISLWGGNGGTDNTPYPANGGAGISGGRGGGIGGGGDTATGRAGGGGGGGGYFGGGGGNGAIAASQRGGGGGGGASFANSTIGTSRVLLAGGGLTAGNAGDADRGTAGTGGAGGATTVNGTAGTNGKVMCGYWAP